MKLLLVPFCALILSVNAGARIVGGAKARTGQFPYSAAIKITGPGSELFCGGTLIDRQWILTAAQCIIHGTSFEITLGSTTLDSLASNASIHSTTLKYLHPGYNPLINMDNDIGLLKMRRPVELTPFVQLAHTNFIDIYSGMDMSAIGWGQVDDETPGTSNTLQWVTLTAIDNDECRLVYGDQIVDNMVCLVGNFNEGSCLDDTGSPAAVRRAGVDYVMAIASFYSGNGCESTDPSGYQRISPHHNWISSVIKQV